MEWIVCFYLVLGLFGLFCLFCFGRVFIKNDLFSSLLSVILIAGGILAFKARRIPLYTRELLGIMAIIGIINLFTERRKTIPDYSERHH